MARGLESDVCGRFALFASSEEVAQHFGVGEVFIPKSRYNVAPTQRVAVVTANCDAERQFSMMQWGLVPYWAEERSIANSLINARAETVGRKPAFRDALTKRRCIVIASGFYEWGETEEGKWPFFISPKNGLPMAFAGLWEIWRNGVETTLQSCVIITTDANQLLSPVHKRMPAILDPMEQALWLDLETKKKVALELLKPFSQDDLQLWRVGRGVNNPSNEGAGLIEQF